MIAQQPERRPRWLLWVAAIGVITLIGTVAMMMEGPQTPVEQICRPARSGIEQAIQREVRNGKGYKLMEFYGGWYEVAGHSYRMEFASEPGTYRIGDTMWVLYDPRKPEANIVYGHRDGAMHLDRANLENVMLDYDAMRLYIDSVERATGIRSR